MRAVIIIVILAVIGFFGYEYAVNGRDPMTAVDALTGEADSAADTAADAVSDAADGVADAVGEGAEAAAEAADDVSNAAEDAVDDAAAATEEAADAATGAVDDAVEEVTDGAADATDGAPDATDEAADATAAADPAELETLLTPEGFDAERVKALIAESDLSELDQTTLNGAIDAAQDNPDLLEAVLERVQQVLQPQ